VKQIRELEARCGRLEAEIKEELANSAKLSLMNKEVSFSLSNKNEEYLQLQHAMEEQDADFKKSKFLKFENEFKESDHIESF